MATHQRKIFRSDNGDEWWLCREQGGRVFVLHEANLSSGGNCTKIEITDFLNTEHGRAEHQALLRLIGELTKVQG
jgi:hypothetical protein